MPIKTLLSQKLKRTMHNIKLAIVKAGKTDEIQNQNMEIRQKPDIDEKTKDELNKLSKEAKNWKCLQAALETAKKELPKPSVSKNESEVYVIDLDYTRYIDQVFSIENSEYKTFFANMHHQTDIQRIQQPIRTFSDRKIFSSRIRAKTEALKQYTKSLRVLSALEKYATNMKRECKTNFKNMVKKSLKQQHK